jgi:hypothetical protein
MAAVFSSQADKQIRKAFGKVWNSITNADVVLRNSGGKKIATIHVDHISPGDTFKFRVPRATDVQIETVSQPDVFSDAVVAESLVKAITVIWNGIATADIVLNDAEEKAIYTILVERAYPGELFTVRIPTADELQFEAPIPEFLPEQA